MPPKAKKAASEAAATALDAFQARFAKRHGAGRMRIAAEVRPYRVIPTGSIALDVAMGCGGYVRGRITQSWGAEDVGKTTMALLGAAQAQLVDPDRIVAWLDVEHKLDLKWAEALGVDLRRLALVEPQTTEEVADIVKDLVIDRQGVNGQNGDPWFSQVVVDSIGFAATEEEFEKDAGDATVGTNAKIITRMVKLAAAHIGKAETSLHLINQTRAIIGPKGGSTQPGGFALKHCTTHKLKYARGGSAPLTIGSEDTRVQIGQEVSIKVEKNQVASPGRVATLWLMNTARNGGRIGIDPVPEALRVGAVTGVIERGGAWYTLPNGERFMGQAPVLEALRADPRLVELVREKVLETLHDQVSADGPLPPVDLDAIAAMAEGDGLEETA